MRCRLTTSVSGLADKVSFMIGDAENIPFPDSSFSHVWSMNMFYHIPDKAITFKEFARVIEAGGTLAFDDWVITEKTTSAEHERLRQKWQNPWFGTLAEYVGFMKDAGLHIEKLLDLSPVGSILMPKYFKCVFESYFKPRILELFPRFGLQIANSLLKDIMYTVQLYQEGKFAYYQLCARK